MVGCKNSGLVGIDRRCWSSCSWRGCCALMEDNENERIVADGVDHPGVLDCGNDLGSKPKRLGLIPEQ